jgi:hypothetical protein
MNKNILLISPASDNEALWVTGDEGPEVKNNVVPLGLATIAALTPDDFHVDIWDENVHGVIGPDRYPEKEYGLAGITGYKAHMPRCLELARMFRKRSIPVVLGGPGVSATPDEYRGEFDVLFIGEAEKIWPKFLQNWKEGKAGSEYRQVESVDLAASPLPRWESIARDMHKYSMGSVQTTRGCPFDCEFCDVVYLFGRRPRHKPIENVLAEIKELHRLGVRTIFFSDDEFVGDRQYAMRLLKELILLNRSFPNPVSFSTQLTLRVSQSEELLGLLADARFEVLFIGIETPNEESLKESGKRHNLVGDMIGNIHKILSHGMVVRAGIMVGFDHDGPDIFDIQYDFIQKSFIPSVAINMLKAPFGTRLWDRLRREERVVFIPPGIRKQLGHPRTYTTIIPKRMSRLDLMKGYRNLLDKTFSWESFAVRVCGFISLVGQASKQGRVFSGRLDAPRLLNLDDFGGEAQKSVERILANTRLEAPFFLPKVQSLIVQHAKYRETIDKLLPQLDRQIDMESTGRILFDMDRRPILIPDGFKDAYNDLFRTVYRTVVSRLDEKTKPPRFSRRFSSSFCFIMGRASRMWNRRLGSS